jgi:hypothetical protein
VAVTAGLGVAVGLIVGVALSVKEGDALGVALAVGDALNVGVAVALGRGVGLRVGVALRLGVKTAVAVPAGAVPRRKVMVSPLELTSLITSPEGDPFHHLASGRLISENAAPWLWVKRSVVSPEFALFSRSKRPSAYSRDDW